MAKKLKNVVAVSDDDTGTGAQTPNPDPVNALIEKLGLNGITKTTLDHNRWTSLGVTLGVLLIGIVKGLQPTTNDPFYPGQKATVATIKSEHDQIVADLNNKIAQSKKDVADMQVKVEIVEKQIEQDNQQLAAVVSTIGTAAAPLTGPFAPVVLAGVGLAVAGLSADTIRKGGQATDSSNAANAANAANNATSGSGGTSSNGTQTSVTTQAEQFATSIFSLLPQPKTKPAPKA
jgi:hypothetical protein